VQEAVSRGPGCLPGRLNRRLTPDSGWQGGRGRYKRRWLAQ
jgi:hypothetical protein